MTAAVFSADGSVLAVAAETVVTLWDPENNVRVAVLEEIETVIFVIPTIFVCFFFCTRKLLCDLFDVLHV